MALPGYAKTTLSDLPTSNVNAGTNYFVVSEQRWYYYNGTTWIKHNENLTASQIQSFIDTQTQLDGFITTSQNTVSTLNNNFNTLQNGFNNFSNSVNATLGNFESRIVSVENNNNSNSGSGSTTTDYTELLLKFNGTNNSTDFIDDSKNNYLIIPTGNPIISTDQSRFGGSSLYLNGSSALSLPSINFKTNWTIETWFKTSSSGYIIPF